MNESKNVFISFPMRGKSYNELILERERIIEKVNKLISNNAYYINTLVEDPDPDYPLWYLGKALEELAYSDLAIFTNGWENARGCKIEYECAKQYGIPILILG